jgi:polyadenylate-binding protein
MQGMPPIVAPQPYAMQPPMPEPVISELPNDKEQLGEYLYPRVETKAPMYAAKITGMLLEMDVKQIHSIIMDATQLDKWISEAMRILNKAE